MRVNRVDALGREMMECVQTQIKDIKFEARPLDSGIEDESSVNCR